MNSDYYLACWLVSWLYMSTLPKYMRDSLGYRSTAPLASVWDTLQRNLADKSERNPV